MVLQLIDVDGVTVRSDEQKVQHILKLLIDNAIKFTPKGSVTIDVLSNSEISEVDGELVVRVADTGIGIDKSDVEKIF